MKAYRRHNQSRVATALKQPAKMTVYNLPRRRPYPKPRPRYVPQVPSLLESKKSTSRCRCNCFIDEYMGCCPLCEEPSGDGNESDVHRSIFQDQLVNGGVFAPSVLPALMPNIASSESAGDEPQNPPPEMGAGFCQALRAHCERFDAFLPRLTELIYHGGCYDYSLEAASYNCVDESRHAAALLTPAELQTFSRVLAGRVACAESFQWIAFLKPFWLRPLISFLLPAKHEAKTLQLLLEHLFVRYPAPACLLRLPTGFKPLLWLVCLGRGESLSRMARVFGWNEISDATAHHLFQAPAKIEFHNIPFWFELCREGASATEYRRLNRFAMHGRLDWANQPVQKFDWNQGCPSDLLRGPLRTQTIQWLVRHREGLTNDTTTTVLLWATHMKLEADRIGNAFSWKGRTLARVLEQAVAYDLAIREMKRDGPRLAWPGREWDWEWQHGARRFWTVRELCSSGELATEGQAMHHCVASYAFACASGDAAIFSLTCNGIRVLTVELEPHSLRVRQARGACNRAATFEEKAIVERWLTEKVLRPVCAHAPV
ncbi:MAG: PcfJ domain-containing protein [Limisphaerales bacterium]